MKNDQIQSKQHSNINEPKTTPLICAVPVSDKIKGESQIYRNPSHKDQLLQIPSNITSLAEWWDRSVCLYTDCKLVQDYTFKQVDEIMRRVGSWVIHRGHKLMFMYSKNCPYWTITDISCMNYQLVNVPLYDTLGVQAFNHILKITQGTLVFTTNNLVEILCNILSANKYNVKQVCLFNQIDKDNRQKLQKLNITISSFQDALNYDNIKERPKMNLDSQLTIGFTSGSTGMPKGVVFTHRMIISQCQSTKGHIQYNSTDVHLSFLPVAHTFERFITWMCIMYGTNIRYSKHPITEIVKDFAISKPTVIIIVPKLLNKFYPILKSMYQKQGNYDKVKGLFGGRLRLMTTGSAPVAPAILSFYRQALNADIRQGYGQTETTAGTFVTLKGDTNYGHVGAPTCAIEFKLVDVPELNYFTDGPEPKGQIYVRGEPIFKKYYKDPQNTALAIDKDCWNHSGDIGVILPNGALKIIDRKKNIFKLQQGQYVAPEKVQNVYARCKFVTESYVYGDSMRDLMQQLFIQPLKPCLQQLRIQELKKKMRKNFVKMIKQGKNDGLMGFQQAKKIKLSPDPFSSLGIVTSTMKLQRYIAKDKFKKDIEQLYK